MADFPKVIRPQSYTDGRGPQVGASDLMGAMRNTRPSMKQDSHPDHSMPEPEHDGVETRVMSSDARQMLEDRKNYGKNDY